MMRSIVHMGSMLLGALLLAAPVCAEEQLTLKTPIEKDSYRTGVDIVRSLKQRGGQIDLDLVIRGMKDGLTGENMLMSDDDIRKDLAAREPGSTDTQQKQQANQNNPSAAAPQKQVKPEQSDEPSSNTTFAKTEGQTKTPGQGSGVSSPSVPFTQSLAQRGRDRNARKLQSLEMRKHSIEQGL